MLIYILSRSEQLYTTKRIYRSGTKKRHNVRVINYMECDLLIEDGEFKVVYEHEVLLKPDYVIPRIGSSVTFYGCTVVRHFEMMGVQVLNPAEAILNSRDKFRSLQLLINSQIRIPKTYFSDDLYYAERIVRDNLGFPFVMKVLEGTQGQGVYLVPNEAEAQRLIDLHVQQRTKVILQEYIAEFSGKDIRIIVIGGKVIACMMRIAAEGDFRSNIHRGGRGEMIDISEQEREMALRAVEVLGLQMAGVDIMRSQKGPVILEVNSSPGMEGIEGVTKAPIAESLIEFIETQIK